MERWNGIVERWNGGIHEWNGGRSQYQYLISIITSYMARAGDRVCASMPGRPRSIKCNAVYKATLKSAFRSDSTKRPFITYQGWLASSVMHCTKSKIPILNIMAYSKLTTVVSEPVNAIQFSGYNTERLIEAEAWRML